jgi:hypothetical protein
MTNLVRVLVLGLSMSLLNAAAADAAPSRYTIENAARAAGCTKYSPKIRMLSQSGGYLPQYVFQVECDPLAGTYVIVVCEGDFRCWVE